MTRLSAPTGYAARDPVPPEYSIERLTCAIASRLDVVMVGWPGAAQDRLSADVPVLGVAVLVFRGDRAKAAELLVCQGDIRKCPVAVMGGARWRPPDLPSGGRQTCPRLVSSGGSLLSGDGLGEADAVAAGLADVGVVHEPVDGGGGQGFRHQLVESRRVKIRADRDAAALVGGVDDPVEALGGVGSDGQQPDVVRTATRSARRMRGRWPWSRSRRRGGGGPGRRPARG